MIALLTFSNREWRPIASCRRYTTLIATCCVVLCVAHGVAMAQQGTPSHRLLGNGLPTLSGTQPQMELLLRLQKLAGAAQAAGTEIPGLQNPDSQAMRSLQQALQNLQQLTGGSATPAPENRQTGEQPGVGLSAGQSHPRPEPGSNSPGPASSGNGSSGNASPGQELSGRSSTDGSGEGKLPERSVLERIAEQMGLTLDRPGNPSLKPGSEGAGTSSRQPGQADRTGERSRPTDSGPPDSGRSIPGTEPEPDRSPGGGLQNVPRDTTGTDNFFPKDSTDASPRTPGSSAPGNDTSRSFVPQSNPSTGEIDAVKNGTRDSPKGSMQSLLDWLAGRDQSASNDGSSGSAAGTSQARGATTPGGQAGSDWFPGSGIAPPRTPDGNVAGMSGRNRSRDPATANNNGHDVEPTQRPGQPDRSASSTAQSGSNRSGSVDGTAQSLALDRLQAARENRLNDLRGSSKTLQEKFAEIAQLARSESGRENLNGDSAEFSAATGLKSAFMNALQEASKDLAVHVDELVRDSQSVQHGRDWRRRQPPRRERGTFERIGRFGERANDWFVDVVDPVADLAVGTGNSVGVRTGDSGFPVSVDLLLALGLVGGFIFWMQQRRRVSMTLQSSTSAKSTVLATLQSRADIVRAFHDLAAGSPAVVADWWTHDRAALALATSRPDVDVDLRKLAELYEQARYLPDESTLTDEQLAIAKAAWLRCRKS